MATNGNLIFQDTNKATFVGANSNVVIDTVNASLGVGVDVNGPTSNLHVVGNAYVTSNLEVGTANLFVDTVNSRVGIGTSSPGRPLEIAAGGGGAILNIKRTDAGTGQGAIGFVNMNSNVCASITSARSGTEGGELRFFTAPNDTTQTSDNPYLINERMRIDADGNVGIGTTTPNATLHIKNETESSGTGDVYLPGVINKPTECLRLQNKWHNTGSGALLRFTNQHPQGTNPSTGEYNLAGIAGYDHDGSWGGGLAFYTSPGSGSGGDDLTLRMSIDSTGAVNIPGPTTGAAHGSASMLYLLDTCFFKEWSYANYVAPTVKVTFNTSTEIPDGAKAVLAEVFLSRDDLTTGDHQIHVLGKNHLGNQTNWRGGAGQPSTAFSADVDVRQTVELLMPGESDGFTHYFGKWHSSVIIPLENNKIYYSNKGNSSSTGWVYMRVRGYYI